MQSVSLLERRCIGYDRVLDTLGRYRVAASQNTQRTHCVECRYGLCKPQFTAMQAALSCREQALLQSVQAGALGQQSYRKRRKQALLGLGQHQSFFLYVFHRGAFRQPLLQTVQQLSLLLCPAVRRRVQTCIQCA